MEGCPSYTKQVGDICIVQQPGAFRDQPIDQNHVLLSGHFKGKEVGRCDAHGTSTYELIPTDILFSPQEVQNVSKFWKAVPGSDLVFIAVDKPDAGNLCVNIGNQSDARSKIEALLSDETCEGLFEKDKSRKCEALRTSLQRKYKAVFREDPPMGSLQSIAMWISENKGPIAVGTLIFRVLVPFASKFTQGGGGHGGGGASVSIDAVALGKAIGESLKASEAQVSSFWIASAGALTAVGLKLAPLGNAVRHFGKGMAAAPFVIISAAGVYQTPMSNNEI